MKAAKIALWVLLVGLACAFGADGLYESLATADPAKALSGVRVLTAFVIGGASGCVFGFIMGVRAEDRWDLHRGYDYLRGSGRQRRDPGARGG